MTEADTHKDFICRCGDAAQRAEALEKEFFEQINARASRPITYENLLTFVVYDLQDDGVSIVGMPSDQWAAVVTEQHQYVEADDEGDNDGWSVVHRTYIQCDRLEDGLIATWMHYDDRRPKKDVIEGE